VIEDLLFELAQKANEVTHLQRKADSISAWKSGLKTTKRPRLDRTKTGKDRTSSPVFSFSTMKDRSFCGFETGPGPVLTGLLWP
jgi:hypothetical protein